jgi:hypothetical protein
LQDEERVATAEIVLLTAWKLFAERGLANEAPGEEPLNLLVEAYRQDDARGTTSG